MIDRTALAQTWWELLQIPADEFFADRPERRGDASAHGSIMSPGYVGSRYDTGGWLLVGNYPAGGTDSYATRPDQTDERLYRSFETLAQAKEPDAQRERFETLSATWIELQRRHRIYTTLIQPLLQACGKADEQMAFLNLFPFRCRDNAAPSSTMYRRAWNRAVARQLALLQPGRIIALGVTTGRILQRLYRDDAALTVLERSNGDRYLKDSARAAIARLASGTAEAPPEPDATPTAQVAEAVVPDHEPVRRPASPSVPSQKSVSTPEEYRWLFQKLGFTKYEHGKILQHPQGMPSLYFNYKKTTGNVFFTGYRKDIDRYRQAFWERIAAQQPRDDQSRHITLRPRSGLEQAAFEDLLRR